jgi:uncharacterized protein (TIGR03067 family)
MNTFTLLALALPLSAPALKDRPPKDSPIVGEWVRVGYTRAGAPGPADDPPHRQVFKADGEWAYYDGDQKAGSPYMSFAIDPGESPPTIDLHLNPPGGEVRRGIYKVEKDTLTVCLARGVEKRPKVFESTRETNTTLWVFKRVKPKD